MTLSRQNQKRSHNWMLLLYLLFFISIFFSLRALTSISTGLLIISGIALNKIESGNWFNKKMFNLFVLSCFLYFLLQFAGLLYTHDLDQQWNSLRIKTALVFIPLAVGCCDFINPKSRHALLTGYCILLFATSLFCLVSNLVNYTMHQNADVFFYHDLVAPVSQHAIQFSILVFVGLIFLFENWGQGKLVLNKYSHVLLMSFFSIFLLLLSSKLIIAFYLVYLLYFSIFFYRSKTNRRWLLPAFITALFSLLFIVFLTRNPVSKRFNEVITGNMSLIRQEKFTPGDYFNGLQFRLLQWRFVPEMLTENHSWIAGVSAGDAQQELDQKYISENMYTGEAFRHDRGFLGYNTHNQFLESLLQSGMMGALIFLFICFSMIKIAWTKKNRVISFTLILLLLYSFSDSVFETQYSLLIFTFLPLFLSNNHGINNTKSE